MVYIFDWETDQKDSLSNTFSIAKEIVEDNTINMEKEEWIKAGKNQLYDLQV